MRSLRTSCAALLFALAQASSYLVPSPEAASATVVISQVYGGGGNTGAVFTHDFIGLHNRGPAAVSLDGWSLQYASATGTGNLGANSGQLTPLSGTIPPGGFLLVQEAGGAGAGDPLPTPDITDPTPINMSGSSGKVALVSIPTSLGCNGGSTPCDAAALAQIVDLVGYGNANFFEGTGAAPGTANATAVLRVDGPDTDNNSVDFVLGTPNPRNSTGTGLTPTLTVADVSLNEGDTENTTATFVVQLSREAGLGGVGFTIATEDGTATTADLDYVSIGPLDGFIAPGATSQSFTITVNADLRPEPDETFFVNVTHVTGNVSVTDAQAVGTIRNDDVESLAIHDIQGAGASSPKVGQTVATTGIVTARKPNGFFLQTPDADADASTDTSEAVFVFTSTPPLTVAVGDAVRVTGRVVEFRRSSEVDTLTEITPPLTVTVLSQNNPLPEAVGLASSDPDAPTRNAQLERYEGMLVSAPSLTAVAPTDRNGEFYAVLSGAPRPFREPGIEKTDVLPADAPPLVARFDGNFERFIVQTGETLLPSGARAPEVLVSTGATFAPVLAPLDFAFDSYRLLLPGTFLEPTTPGIAPRPLSDGAARELTVVSLNVLNFFPTSGSPASQAAFAVRVQRTAETIVNELRTPDILGLIEVGDINGLRQLRDRINALAATSYEAYLVESDDDTENDQDVGYLVNLVRVQVERDPYPIGRGSEFELCGIRDTLLDRPPFVLEARVDDLPVTVILNHLRSLIDVNSTAPFGGIPPCEETVGSRVREKRRLGAEFLADAIEDRQDENLVVIGDMNAFEVNDGYGDIIGTLEGAPAAPDTVVEPSADRWSYTMTSLARLVPAEERYSYVFEGNAQVLDHILVTSAMRERATSFGFARINADFPEDVRQSDHDAAFARFAPVARLSTTTSLPAALVSGSAFSFDVTVSNAGPDRADEVAVIATLPPGVTFESAIAPEGWSCAPAAATVTCTAASLAPEASAHLVIHATAACDLSNASILTVTTAATSPDDDESGDNGSSDSVTVSNPAPVITGASADKTVLWPANHAMHDVRISYAASDNCGTPTVSLSVTSSEPVSGTGDGDTAPDWEVVGPNLVRLRAERAGNGTGRTYTVAITATDSAGNASTQAVTVAVPHNR